MDFLTPVSSFVSGPPPAVVPVLVGPMSALFAILPAIAVAIAKALWQLLGPKGLWRMSQLLWRQKLPVALLAGAVVGVVYAWPYVVPEGFGRGAGGAMEAGNNWTVFRGQLDRCAFQPGKMPNPDHGKKRIWSFVDKDIQDFFSSPALVGNRVYITSAKYDYFSNKGSICCVDADTGTGVWTYSRGYRATFSSPSVKGKYLVVGEGLHLTKDAKVVCLDVKASEQQHRGVKLWEHQTKSHVESSPCIYDDKVVVGAGDDGVYCFALDPNKNGNPDILWHLDPKEYPDCETSPVYLDGKLYWGLGRYGGEAVVCVDANTGKEAWRVKTPSPVVGSPAIAHGKLYVGMGYGDFVNSADAVAAALPQKLKERGRTETEIQEALKKYKREGEVWCINLADHQVAWKYTVGQVVLATPAVDANTSEVYAASRDGKLYCIAPDGKSARSFDFNEPLLASPAVSNDLVYVVTGSGRVCGLDKVRFKPVWNVSLNAPSSSSPAIGRGHLFVGTNGLGLVCLGMPAEPWRRTAVWPGELGGAGMGGWDESVLPKSSEYAWGYAGADPNQSSEFAATIKAPAASIGEDLYVGIGKGLSKIHCEQGLAGKPVKKWQAPSDNPVYLSASGSQRAVFFVDGKAGDTGRFLHCVDPNSGAELWRRAVAKDASGASVLTWDPAGTAQRWHEAVEANAANQFTFTWDRLLIAENPSGLTCLDTSNAAAPKEVWKAEVGPTVGAPCLLGDEVVLVAVASPAKIVAIEPNSGQRKWEIPLPGAPTTGPVLAGSRVWVADANGLVGCWLPGAEEETKDARPDKVWTVPCGPLRPALAACGFWIACVTQDGEQVLVNAGSAVEYAKLGKIVGNVPPVLTDEEVLYLTKGSIQRYDLHTGKSDLWTKITSSWPGNILTPMIVANSYVVFTTDEEGIVCMKPKK